MSIEKGLYSLPGGNAAQQDDPIEIEIENPDAVNIKAGDMELSVKPGQDEEFGRNLAEDMPESMLAQLAGDLVGEFDEDVASRKDWIQTYTDGLELLGLKVEERSEPWEGACNVVHPILTEAVIKFQAETMMSTFPAMGPVKTQIVGKETQEKKEAAERVQTDMNYQLTDVMVEYRPEHERMLWGLGLAGNAFKKVYYDPSLGRPTSMYVSAEDVVVPYGASNLETAERVTHVMRKTKNEMARLQYSGFYRDIELGEPSNTLDEVEKSIADKLGFRASTDSRYKLLEMHVDLDLPGFEDEEDGELTGIALPYVVTIDKGTAKILSIRRNWRPDDELKKKRNHFAHYGYVPGFGFYCFGLIHLIGAFAKSGTSLIRQLVDAGTLSNLPGGFKARGMRIKGDDTPIEPGEFRDVDIASGTMRDNILPLPYKEPSQVLMALLESIIQEGRNFAGFADLQISDMSAQAPVGTTLAILERTLKMMSAIQSRIHFSMKQEFKLLKELIQEDTPETYDYDPDEGDRHAKKSDYDLVAIIPVSDPNAATMAQKVVQYQAVLQLAQSAPQLYDMSLLHRQMLDALGIKNYQKLIPSNDDMKPRDPVTENQNVLAGKPVKAFLYQDHKAHIVVHMAAAQDPHIASILGQNPQEAQQLMATMQAHIAEHLGYEYRRQIEQTMGIALPTYGAEGPDGEDDPQVGIPPQIEVKVAQMAAQAAQQLLQQHTQEAQAAQAAQQQQDPLVQLQQQEMQVKQMDIQRKIEKDKSDAQVQQQKIALDNRKLDAQTQITGAQVVTKAQNDAASLAAKTKLDAIKVAADITKHSTGLHHQQQQSHLDRQSKERQAQMKVVPSEDSERDEK